MTCSEINIRDPYVIYENGTYYMYGTRAANFGRLTGGFDVYTSTDMETWSDPIPCFDSEKFGLNRECNWAPEVHIYQGAYYLLATFTRECGLRGTFILRADNPLGPFVPHGEKQLTPDEWECLDGTLYVSPEGKPWIVFCHEWVQVKDGEMCAVRLTEDLSAPAGEPFLLFKASESGWAADIRNGEGCRITDGPYLRRMASGALMLIWSSAKRDGDGTCYATGAAISESGRLTGPWHHRHPFLFHKDGGHAMFFTDHTDTERLVLHQPNKPAGMERARLFTVTEENGEVRIRE